MDFWHIMRLQRKPFSGDVGRHRRRTVRTLHGAAGHQVEVLRIHEIVFGEFPVMGQTYDLFDSAYLVSSGEVKEEVPILCRRKVR